MKEQDLHANYRCYLGAFTARVSGAVPTPGGTLGSDAAQALGVQHANMLERPLDELRSINNMKKTGLADAEHYRDAAIGQWELERGL